MKDALETTSGTGKINDEIPALLLSETDDVATLLSPAEKGALVRILSGGGVLLALDAIPLYHKIALRPVSRGETVLKYGVAIGRARQDIPVGAWVHLHTSKAFSTKNRPLWTFIRVLIPGGGTNDLLDRVSAVRWIEGHTGLDSRRPYGEMRPVHG